MHGFKKAVIAIILILNERASNKKWLAGIIMQQRASLYFTQMYSFLSVIPQLYTVSHTIGPAWVIVILLFSDKTVLIQTMIRVSWTYLSYKKWNFMSAKMVVVFIQIFVFICATSSVTLRTKYLLTKVVLDT